MSGHSKWASIKHKKAVVDSRRGAQFSKLTRAIMIAARDGGGDPAANLTLENAVRKAREASMPKDNIERAIAKGTGEAGEANAIEAVTYEGYGPGGAAILIQATTDNANRTVAEIRHAFSRHAGNLGATNSVAWMFDRKGEVEVDAMRADEDLTMEAALDAGAEDMVREGDVFLITTPPQQLHAVQEALTRKRLPVRSAAIVMLPKSTVKVEGGDAKRLLALMEALEEMDDVAKVSSNFDVPAEVLERVAS